MIKAVLFDFDGVLTIEKTGSQSIIKYIADKAGVPEDVLKKEYYKYNKGLLYGEYTHQEIWDKLCEGVGQNLDYGLLKEAFHQSSLDDEMFAIVRELRKKYLTGMITDNKLDRMEEVFDYYNLHGLFDVVSVSAVYKSGKSEKLIFEKTLTALNLQPEECVFIDNFEQNLIVPREMGFHTILFDDEKRNIEVFRRKLDSELDR